jgi:hypothetical protein
MERSKRVAGRDSWCMACCVQDGICEVTIFREAK